jgi:hypothetical protein
MYFIPVEEDKDLRSSENIAVEFLFLFLASLSI